MQAAVAQSAAVAPGAHDQADRDAGDHAVSVGAPGRGEVRAQFMPARVCHRNSHRTGEYQSKLDRTAFGAEIGFNQLKWAFRYGAG